jgi:benzoyl-CoA reductase/2-hydroxyglutaryl-CoA dehydratase subunit BcrC/BadD/HgdB
MKIMAELTQDIASFKSLLDLALDFVGSREKLKHLKLHKKKHLIGCIMPNVELVCAVGAIPVYPIRMQPFGNPSLLKAIDLGRTLIGKGMLTNLIQIIHKFDQTKTIKNMMNNLINGVFYQYNKMFDLGVEKGVPSDECYGIKVITGSFSSKGKNLSGALLQSIRCSAFQKSYESWNNDAPIIYMDVPPFDTPQAHQVAVQEVNSAIEQLENITGTSVSNANLMKWCEITNECKDYSQQLIDIALGNKYPLNPVSMGEILALIEICFQDFNSDPKRFRDILKSLVAEMQMRIQKGTDVIDVSDRPKILFTSRFGGWDHVVGDYVYESGGRILYADWFIHGYMTRIKTSGDMVDNYANYLQANALGFGPDNKGLVNKIVDFTLKNKIDGVIYNQLFGCHSLTTAYTRLRKELMKEEIPSTLISFNNIGENREQTKTRCVALMELLKD